SHRTMRHLLLAFLIFCFVAARMIDNDHNDELVLSRRAANVLATIRGLRREEKKALENLQDAERAEVEELLEQHELQKRSRKIRRQL
ncbi:hypothetical protein PMAYCL1PPCAC_09025, partial [Pristionchus mayeri]